MATPLAIFGPGILIATRTDTTTPVAINIGDVQELTLDYTATVKQLYGQFQFPLVAARGTIKATGKFKAALVSGIAINALYWGGTFSTSSANQTQWTIGSTFTTGSTGGTGAIQVGSSLTFDADLGVTYSTTNLPLQRVSTGNEVVGKYSLTAGSPGLYNFNDQAANIKITYTSNTGTAGQNLLMTNQLIGTTPTFQLDYYTNLNQPASKPFVVRIYEAVAEKLVYNFKLEDYMIPELDFGMYANSAGQIFNKVWPEVD